MEEDRLNNDLNNTKIVNITKNNIAVKSLSEEGYSSIAIYHYEIIKEKHRCIIPIGFFLSIGYAHLYGVEYYPNNWNFDIYNTTSFKGQTDLTVYFLIL